MSTAKHLVRIEWIWIYMVYEKDRCRPAHTQTEKKKSTKPELYRLCLLSAHIKCWVNSERGEDERVSEQTESLPCPTAHGNHIWYKILKFIKNFHILLKCLSYQHSDALCQSCITLGQYSYYNYYDARNIWSSWEIMKAKLFCIQQQHNYVPYIGTLADDIFWALLVQPGCKTSWCKSLYSGCGTF